MVFKTLLIETAAIILKFKHESRHDYWIRQLNSCHDINTLTTLNKVLMKK